MKKFFVLIAALAASLYVADAQNLKQCLKTAPAELFLPADSLNREKLFNVTGSIGYSGAQTIFGDSVMISRVNDNFISFDYASACMEIKKIGGSIIVAKTVGNRFKESELYFYDASWNLNSSWIFGVKHSDYMPCDEEIRQNLIVRPDTMSMEDFESLKKSFDPFMVRVSLSDIEDKITLEPVCPLLFDEEKTRVQSLVRQKIFKWTDGKFK